MLNVNPASMVFQSGRFNSLETDDICDAKVLMQLIANLSARLRLNAGGLRIALTDGRAGRVDAGERCLESLMR